MKKTLKNEVDLLNLITRIQAQLIALDMKIDTLMHRSMSETKQSQPTPVVKPQIQNNERPKYKAICADCNKECTIPFKPSGDRPVYCQDCFSKRKMIRLSGMKVEEKPKITIEEPTAKVKKKNVIPKKAITKKKSTPKKK